MNHKLILATIAGAAISTLSRAESPVVRDFTVPATTSPPYTYCIAYLPDPDKESFLSSLKAGPPDLFHLGYHIPFKGALGPTYGHELFSDNILPPDQIPREIERIQGLIRNMRAAGVRRLIPYVYSMAFFGNPRQRTGFFHFYDHWDDYRSFGLGPKPPEDPVRWLQEFSPGPLGGGPPDVLHYHPCVNHPAWQEYLDLVVRQLAALDYNGMFFDVNTQECYCPHCQDKFDAYLLGKYGRAGLRQTFGTDDRQALNLAIVGRDFEVVILGAFKKHLAEIWSRRNLSKILGADKPANVKLEEDWRLLRCYMQDSAAEFPPADNFARYLANNFGAESADRVPENARKDFVQTVLRRHFHQFLESPDLAALLKEKFGSSDIRRRCCSTPKDLLLWAETQRFWCDSMASLFARLKTVGRATFAGKGRTDDFYTVANLGSMANVDALNKRRVNAIDLPRWAPMADMQMFEEMPQPGSLETGVILSNVFAFRWAMGAGTRAGTLLYKVSSDRAADLAQAEAAAGGGGAFIQPGLDAPESRKRWRRFFVDHADLWDRGTSWARVGLLFWSDQVFYEYPEHLAMAHRLVRVFSESQVPFDIITEENPRDLRPCDLVVAPMLRYLDDAQVARILNYARQGGNLLIIEPFGTEDKSARPRPSGPSPETGPGGPDFQCIPCGRGKLLRLKPQAVPARLSDLWCLMEERANAFGRARKFLNEARRADQQNGVDLGPRFIKRLEESLALSLRWCPPGTDPAVYVHAYRLPPGQGRPQRLVVHAVNYHVPILLENAAGRENDPTWSPVTRSGEPVVSRNLRITLPLPDTATVTHVAALSPTDAVTPVKWSVEGSRAVLTVDRLETYQAIAIDLTSNAGNEPPEQCRRIPEWIGNRCQVDTEALRIEGLRKAESFRLALIEQGRDVLLAENIVRFRRILQEDGLLAGRPSLDGFDALTPQNVAGAIRGTGGISIEPDTAFQDFTGRWYGLWRMMKVDHCWAEVDTVPPPLGPVSCPLPLAMQFAWLGDGFCWHLVGTLPRQPESRVILGTVYHIANARIQNPVPHVAIPAPYGRLVWITPSHVFFEEVTADQKYAITGFEYSIAGGRLSVRNNRGFQAVYTRSSADRPRFSTFPVSLENRSPEKGDRT